MKADLIKYISKINKKPSAQGKLLEQFISHGASTIPELSLIHILKAIWLLS